MPLAAVYKARIIFFPHFGFFLFSNQILEKSPVAE